MTYDKERFSPIDIKVNKGELEGEILHGYIDLEAEEDCFYSEPKDDAETIIPFCDDNWVEVEQDENGERKEIDWDAPLYLTPKGCFTLALSDLHIVGGDFFDSDTEECRTLNNCFDLFEKRMKKAGWISDENNEFHYTDESEKPDSIFERTVNAFYPDSNKDQRDAAYEMFTDTLNRHQTAMENADKNK